MTIRVAAVGCGQHAMDVLYPMFDAAGFELVAICARRVSTASAAAARLGVASAYDNVADMLRRERLDAVVACVPPVAYAEVIRACLAAGLPCFAEKPGAADATEAAELARISVDRGIPVMVGYMKRFAPAYRQARACLTEPGFGATTLGTFSFVMGEFDEDFAGYVIDNPVHHLDLARYLLGELAVMHVTRGPSAGGRHAVSVTARTESGAPVVFQLGSTGSWYSHNESVHLWGGSGGAVLVDNVDTCVLRPATGPEQVWRPNYTIPLPENLTPTTLGFLPELAHFRDVVTERVECESSMDSAARTLALAEAVLTGARSS
ncbi:MAG TPA: Gfo/Idh/MocA family oxidoreductase [Micromonosporaceae bacterium]